MVSDQNTERKIDVIAQFYAALNRNDLPAALSLFHPEILRVEPPGFHASGIYRGLEAMPAHFANARATWAEGSCEPERTYLAGGKFVALVHVRVRLNGRTDWLEGRVADVFGFEGDKITEMRTFLEEREALKFLRAE